MEVGLMRIRRPVAGSNNEIGFQESTLKDLEHIPHAVNRLFSVDAGPYANTASITPHRSNIV